MHRCKKRPIVVSDSSSDSDDFLPSINKKEKHSIIKEQLNYNFSAVIEDINELRKVLQVFKTIDRRTKIPVALYNTLSETFKWNICHKAPIDPPVIFSRCCKSIIGCQICVNTWYRGDDGITKKYPLCRTDRALPETMQQHGLDDFLHAIKSILGEPQAACQEEINTE